MDNRGVRVEPLEHPCVGVNIILGADLFLTIVAAGACKTSLCGVAVVPETCWVLVPKGVMLAGVAAVDVDSAAPPRAISICDCKDAMWAYTRTRHDTQDGSSFSPPQCPSNHAPNTKLRRRARSTQASEQQGSEQQWSCVILHGQERATGCGDQTNQHMHRPLS